MDGVLDALPYMGYGMVGIFLVTGVIILTVSLLNKLTNKKDK
ncbi:MAG: oxaloacetate decarboxylase [Clostridia bacterium]|nr:oxaloacetate decarboxylase [Clostridia bacterium]